VPLVVVGRPPHGADVDHVDADNRGGARLATRHLLDAGRRRIAHIAGPSDMVAGIDRLAGYHDALDEAGIAPGARAVAEADFTHDGGIAAMERLLASDPDLDAVFAASDLMAAAALAVLQQRGRRVPDDVALVGYDDAPIATTTRPPLTSIRQPVEEMGREMVALLIQAMERGDRVPRRVILGTELVRRASSAGRAMP
jgi:DNA-binding LacI/PurR family transcriptional regulator